MPHHNTAIHQLLKPLCRHEFEKLAKIHHQGQKLRSVSRWDQWVGLLLGQLSERQSLRDIEANMGSQRHKLYHVGAKPISKSSLARLNERQPHTLFEALFHHLLKRCGSMPGRHGFRFKNPLISLDASLIALSLKLFPWARTQTKKAAVKLHVGLNHSNTIPEFAVLSDGKKSDVTVGRKLIFPKGSIVVFDKAYSDYAWHKSLTDDGIFFVSRLKSNTVYKVVERKDVSGHAQVSSDQIIELNSEHAISKGAPRLRRVGYRCPDTGKHYVFVSNHFKLSPRTIAAIYKARWQVELFFKLIKQNLKIKSFLGRSDNAVRSQIWVAICTYLLVAYARYCCKSSWAISRIVKVLHMNLFDRRSLLQIIKPPEPRPPKSESQMGLAL